VELKENIRRQWWKSMVTGREDVVGLDSSIILPRETWVASGHVGTFTDPLIECLSCHKRFRMDHLQEALAERKGIEDPDSIAVTELNCPHCGTKGQWTEPREFNMMLKTYLGVIEDESGLHYLRPETAQGIFVNFANVMGASRKKPPFGIAQTGKSFRNEITPGNFIFRTREFEQMEMEFFVKPGEDEKWHQYWIDERTAWYVDLGINPDNLRHFEHPAEKLSHYSKRTVDIEYRFNFTGSEWGELEGIANRTDFDLSSHSKHSGSDLVYFDQTTGEKYTPYVIEPAAGLSRSLMTFLVDAYAEDEAPNTKGGVDKRVVLRLDPRLSPVKAAVLPLSRNADLSPMARGLADALRRHWNVEFDDAGAIGKRYRRQDEIGTPFCITVDFDTLEDQAVTIRHRDSMKQERISLDQVEAYLGGHLLGC
jgi:glycyl-tRNA synthetase